MRVLTDLLTLTTNRLEDAVRVGLPIIPWASPVMFFGNVLDSRLATVGINPSDLEFADATGAELSSEERRFHTLTSLALGSWNEFSGRHAQMCLNLCLDYFERNPYMGWFGGLDRLMAQTGFSYLSSLFPACHLDLVPYATSIKWSELARIQRRELLEISAGILQSLIKLSSLEIVILNGQMVVETFAKCLELKMMSSTIEDWSLRRGTGTDVRGVCYVGHLKLPHVTGGVRTILVLGYNHNIQSSFGVDVGVRRSIQAWLGMKVRETL